MTGLPELTYVPPQLPVYQYTVPSTPAAVSVVLPPLQIGEEPGVTLVGLAGGVVKDTSEPYTVEFPDGTACNR